MSELHEGDCACGTVRFAMHGKPLFVHCCHCTDCQRETGSAFAINALIEADRVETVEGAPEPVDTPWPSGRGQQVWRCPTCQVALWSIYRGMGNAVRFVRVGTLDDAGAIVPDIHIYTRSKLPWVVLPEGVPASEGYYRRSELWPAQSLARFETLKR